MRGDRIPQQNPTTDIKEYLSGEEHQDVSSGLGDVDLEHRHHTGLQVICLWSLDSGKTQQKKKKNNRKIDTVIRVDAQTAVVDSVSLHTLV